MVILENNLIRAVFPCCVSARGYSRRRSQVFRSISQHLLHTILCSLRGAVDEEGCYRGCGGCRYHEDTRFAAAPTPLPSWTGLYFGAVFGAGWNDEAVNFTANDPVTAFLVSGTAVSGPAPNGYRLSQSGPVGGFEAGYNWQAGASWLLGLETDFSLAGLSGSASAMTLLFAAPLTLQSTAAQQKTEWYGTVRGRVGWLATPNLLLFGNRRICLQ